MTILYNRKVLLFYYIKSGVQRGRIPLAFSEGCSDSGGIVEGKLGFPSESVLRTLFYLQLGGNDMFKKVVSLVLCAVMLLPFTNNIAYGQRERKNPTREELEKRVEEVARKRGIPSVILKSIARVESVYQQYRSDGSVFTGPSGSIGIMQIYNAYGWFDNDKLKYDIDYNIEAGADVLLRKWGEVSVRLPRTIGNMDPNILEHWYFALWAYNGWSRVNNPNEGVKRHAFQELIYMVAENEYNQKITPISPKVLPKKGTPARDTYFETPTPVHYGDILTYEIGDIVKVDISRTWFVGKSPEDTTITDYPIDTKLEILEGPVLHGGYYWYRVKTQEGEKQGWTIGNVVSKIGHKYPFSDIANSSKKEYILRLHELDIISGNGGAFRPEELITREELGILLSRVLKLSGDKYELNFKDKDDISTWAINEVKSVSKAGIIRPYQEDNTFRPKGTVTVKDMMIICARSLGIEESSIQHKDDNLSLLAESLIFLREKNMFNYITTLDQLSKELTREEACKYILELLNYISK